VSGVGSIHDIASERVLSTLALLELSAVCLYLWNIGPSYSEISATEQCANIKLCVLPHESPSEPLRMLEEAYGMATKKEMKVYEWYKHFGECCVDVSDDLRFRVWWLTKQYSRNMSGSWKHLQCCSQRFEHALILSVKKKSSGSGTRSTQPREFNWGATW
jgi:hypothetical protein